MILRPDRLGQSEEYESGRQHLGEDTYLIHSATVHGA